MNATLLHHQIEILVVICFCEYIALQLKFNIQAKINTALFHPQDHCNGVFRTTLATPSMLNIHLS